MTSMEKITSLKEKLTEYTKLKEEFTTQMENLRRLKAQTEFNIIALETEIKKLKEEDEYKGTSTDDRLDYKDITDKETQLFKIGNCLSLEWSNEYQTYYYIITKITDKSVNLKPIKRINIGTLHTIPDGHKGIDKCKFIEIPIIAGREKAYNIRKLKSSLKTYKFFDSKNKLLEFEKPFYYHYDLSD